DVAGDPAAAAPVAATSADYEAELARREAALLDQLAQREAAVAGLDATYADQLAALAERLSSVNGALVEKSAAVESLQAEAEARAGEIAAADLAFQDELTRLQNGLSAEDARVRAQIEEVYAQLQAAYDQLSAAQAVASRPGDDAGGNDNNPAPPSAPTGDHDD